MSYEFHIERPRDPISGKLLSPISLSEWTAAVLTTDRVRICVNDHVATNSRTNEEIRIAGQPGDAEVYFADEQLWLHVFRWNRRGKVSFQAPLDVPSDPILPIARRLAAALRASIRGDNGEEIT